MQAEVRYARPIDSLRIVLHYRMYRVPQEKHIVCCVIEWTWQFQVRSVFDDQEEMPAVRVVQRFRNEVSCCPLHGFYRLSYKSVNVFREWSVEIQMSGDINNAALWNAFSIMHM